ncbi:MAG: hypothetical protein ACLRO0_00330 [Massilimicrobiota timonensis]
MPLIGMIAAFFAGYIAGLVTGLLITSLRIMPLLAGDFNNDRSLFSEFKDYG